MRHLLKIGCDAADDDRLRLDELARFQIVGTSPEPRFDRIVSLAADIFCVPMAYISLVGKDRQWFKSRIGIETTETERSISFCTHTIQSNEPLVVLDAAEDPRFADSPLVNGTPFIRFYAGAPLVTARGYRLGSLCIADVHPQKSFSEAQCKLLQDLAALAVEQLELRRRELPRVAVQGFADAVGLTMISANASGIIEFVNKAAVKMFGYEREEMIGKPIDLIIPPRLKGAHSAALARVAAGGESLLAGKTVEVVASRRDGSEFPIELSLSVWRNERGVGMGTIIRDISDRKERDARLLRLATHDTLTGLCNRHYFNDLLADVFERRAKVAAVLLDLDGFKDVNDSLGHAVGDALLQAVAIRLQAVLDKNYPVARLGGDEFAVLLPDEGDAANVSAVASTLLRAFETPFEVGGNVFQLGVSIGYAIGPEDGSDPEELVASADLALYEAKKCGGNAAQMFERKMRHASALRRKLQDELLHAHQAGEFVLHYQPQVSLQDGRPFGVEALLRWQHPERGLLPPRDFLPALESSSLALPIGTWVLNEACRQLAEWRRCGLRDLRMSVNLFAAQFLSAGLVPQVVAALGKHRIEPSALELEITEQIALHDTDHALLQIRRLSELGVRIAIDDFGTGYASLLTLQRFPLTTLKIDRGFVCDLLTDTSCAAITRATLSMAAELKLETIAEGIESEDQAAFLRARGCHGGQGFLYGEPAPAADFIRPVALHLPQSA